MWCRETCCVTQYDNRITNKTHTADAPALIPLICIQLPFFLSLKDILWMNVVNKITGNDVTVVKYLIIIHPFRNVRPHIGSFSMVSGLILAACSFCCFQIQWPTFYFTLSYFISFCFYPPDSKRNGIVKRMNKTKKPKLKQRNAGFKIIVSSCSSSVLPSHRAAVEAQ